MTDASHLVTLADVKEALDNSNNEDGLPHEFYKCFWPELKHTPVEVLNNVYLNKELSLSMKSAVVKLLPKKGDLTNIKNWRPISLLNTDYKLLAKIITNKIKPCLSGLISNEQKCGIEGRKIEDAHLNIDAIINH